eukprot:gene4690-5305_t
MDKGDFGYGATVSASYQRPTGIVSTLESISSGLQKPGGTKNVEDRIHAVSQETNKLAKESKNSFKQMVVYINQPNNYRNDFQGSKQEQNRLQQSKLCTEFENALSRYHAIQNVLSLKIRSHINEELHISPIKQNDSANLIDDSSDGTPLIDDQMTTQQMIKDQERELDAIKEREERIQKIETDILDVNEIFRDLAVLIQEQGETIDSIEGNVESAVVHVTDANVQLQRAKDYQAWQFFMLNF